jgi:hypothetical protein
MASALDRGRSCPESAADTAFAVMAPIFVPYFFDSNASGALDASFALDSPRARLCYRLRSGTIEPFDEETDTDCLISGPSSRWLLWLFGRLDWPDCGLVVSGPRADLASLFAGSLPVRNL